MKMILITLVMAFINLADAAQPPKKKVALYCEKAFGEKHEKVCKPKPKALCICQPL